MPELKSLDKLGRKGLQQKKGGRVRRDATSEYSAIRVLGAIAELNQQCCFRFDIDA